VYRFSGFRRTVEKVTKEIKAVAPPPEGSKPEDGEERVGGKLSAIHDASDEQFGKAHRKAGTRHAGVFRRLAT
jgi:hypothetical protein